MLAVVAATAEGLWLQAATQRLATGGRNERRAGKRFSPLRVGSQPHVLLARWLKTSYVPFADCLWLFETGAIPLLVLELVNVARSPALPKRLS